MGDYLDAYRDGVILVTRGAGAIGSKLCAALAAQGAKRVVLLDDLSSAERWNIPKDPRLFFIGFSYASPR